MHEQNDEFDKETGTIKKKNPRVENLVTEEFNRVFQKQTQPCRRKQRPGRQDT